MNVALVGKSGVSSRIKAVLESHAYDVLLLPDPSKALPRLLAEPRPLVVLAALEPRPAALKLVLDLRAAPGPARLSGILVVQPSGATRDVVEFLDAGADDFLARAFNEQIFLARARTLRRRQLLSGSVPETGPLILRSQDLTLHLAERQVHVGGRERELTRLEFDLLSYLLRNRERVLTREELLQAVWRYPETVETRTLDKHVENLRRKLDSAGSSIKTVHGVGYRFLDA